MVDDIVDDGRPLTLSTGRRRRLQVVEHVRDELVIVQERLRLLLVVLAVVLWFVPRVSQLPCRASKGSRLLEACLVHRSVYVGCPWSASKAAVGRAYAVMPHRLLRVTRGGPSWAVHG